MANPFYPGRVDYEGSMARDFNEGRALSPHALAVWRSAFEPYLAVANKILDVGSGTGRFTGLLADWFGAPVIGVEPASEMRRITSASGRRPNTSYVGGRAEQLPFQSNCFGAALLSNVYHHVADRRSCAQELSRVLQSGGCVIIRGAFAGRLGEITLFDYFPEAKLVCEQFPTLTETLENFTAAGLKFETIRAVIQQTCSSLKAFASRTRLRADTTLTLLTDEEFRRRQSALESAADEAREPIAVIDTLDLLVLRKPLSLSHTGP